MSQTSTSPATELPLVTALVGCYNQTRFVVDALESVRLQTYPNIQLIIWDDCSKDNSVEVINSWIRQHNVHCTFLAHNTNLGLCKSLNEALSYAKGKYVAALSADDKWLPDKTFRQVTVMENSPDDVGVVYSDAFQFDEKGACLPQMYYADNFIFDHPPEGFIFGALWKTNFIPAMATLIRRECYIQVGFYDEDLCFEDWDMWLRISRRFRFVHDSIPTAMYRIVSTSMNRTMSAPMWESIAFFRAKCLFRGWLDSKQEKDAVLSLEDVLRRIYQGGGNIPLHWRLEILRRRYSIRIICLVVCATCKLSYQRFQQVLAFGVAFRKMLFREQLYK